MLKVIWRKKFGGTANLIKGVTGGLTKKMVFKHLQEDRE